MFWLLVIKCIFGCIFGRAVNQVIENKGYTQDGFWWGFFFELIALIVAILLPEKHVYINEDENYFGSDESVVTQSDADKDFGASKKILTAAELSKGWKCPVCGEMNVGHMGTCGCGYNASGNI